MSLSGDLLKFGQFCLGMSTTFLAIEALPQQLVAAEIDTSNTNKKAYESAELTTSYQILNSINVADMPVYQSLTAELTQAVSSNESANSIDVAAISSLENLSKEAKLAQAVLSNNDSKNELNNISSNIPQESRISYDAADLQFSSEFTVVERMEEQLLAREVDIDTFCRNYPLNSRCANYQPPEQRQRQKQPDAQPAVERQLSGYAVTGKVSTLGFGIEGTGAISPNFNGRLGFNYFSFGIDTEQSDIEYDADVDLLSATALVDWFPSSRSEFRITGGLAYNNNQVDGTARPARTLEIGGVDVPTELIGQLEGELTFPNTISPYIGIGYGNPVKQGRQFTFSIDLGLLFTGSPEVDLNATGPVAGALFAAPVVGPLLNDALEREEDDIEDELSDLGVYPVLSIGVSYQF